MADNRPAYGFRPWKALGGRNVPLPLECIVATAEAFNVTNGAQGVGLGPGDVVTQLSTGGVTLCPGTETTIGVPFGVVVGVKPYWNATKSVMEYGPVLPSATAWGTVLERQSKLMVVPIDWFIWEVDVDDATTATTLAAYQAFIGENVDMVNTGASGETRAKPKLDIQTHAATNTITFRIVGVSPSQDNQDFSGANVKLLVRANLAQSPFMTATGV